MASRTCAGQPDEERCAEAAAAELSCASAPDELGPAAAVASRRASAGAAPLTLTGGSSGAVISSGLSLVRTGLALRCLGQLLTGLPASKYQTNWECDETVKTDCDAHAAWAMQAPHLAQEGIKSPPRSRAVSARCKCSYCCDGTPAA